MSSSAETTNVATFLRVLRSPGTPRTVCIDSAALQRDAQTGLAAAGRLLGYRDYVTRARVAKSKDGRAAGQIDRAVLAQSHDALLDANTLAVSTLRVVRNLYRGSALDDRMDALRRSLEQSGTVAIIDVWERTTTSDDARSVLRRSGIDDAMRDAFGAAVRAADVRASADGSRIIVAGMVGGVPSQAAITTLPRPARPSGTIDLLSRGRFEVLADAFERGEPAYLDGLGLPVGDLRAEEVAVGGVLTSYHNMVRHVRKLQDIGLDTYQGASGGLIAGLVGLAFILAGIAVGEVGCPERSSSTGHHSDDSPACVIAGVLADIGLALLLALLLHKIAPPIQPSVAHSVGSVVIHGVVRDFAVRVS